MQTNSDQQPELATWQRMLPLRPALVPTLAPAMLPVYTWRAERVVCTLCAFLDYSNDPAMLCTASGNPKWQKSCISMRDHDGPCGPQARLFKAKDAP